MQQKEDKQSTRETSKSARRQAETTEEGRQQNKGRHAKHAKLEGDKRSRKGTQEAEGRQEKKKGDNQS